MKYKIREIKVINVSKFIKKIGDPIDVPKPDKELGNKIIDNYYDNKED